MSSDDDMEVTTSAALADGVLKAQLKSTFGTEELATPDRDLLMLTSSRLTTLAIRLGRSKYSERPDRLKAVFSGSPVANALAVWSGECDWVVLSSGLLKRLQEAADAAANILESKAGFTASGLAKALAALEPLPGGFSSSYSAALYVAALTFFVGHEIGHHLGGHDGYYLAGVVAEAVGTGVSDGIERQALELDADARGVAISQACAAKYLLQVVEPRELSEDERREYQLRLAMLVSLGVFLALSVLKPKSVNLKDHRSRTHPPASLRALWISSCLFDAIKRSFSALDHEDLRALRVLALEWAALASISPGSPEAVFLKEREMRQEPHGMRAMGIRRAIHDPQSVPYMRELLETLETLRPRLRLRG